MCPARSDGTPIIAVLPHIFTPTPYQSEKWSSIIEVHHHERKDSAILKFCFVHKYLFSYMKVFKVITVIFNLAIVKTVTM